MISLLVSEQDKIISDQIITVAILVTAVIRIRIAEGPVTPTQPTDPSDVLGPLRPSPEYPRDKAMKMAAHEFITYLETLALRHQLTAAELMKLCLVVADRQATTMCWNERKQP